jgi:hypothetical protein
VIKVVALAGAGVAVWLIAQGHRDPREWPGQLAEEWARLRSAAKEAIAAGKRAAARREAEIDRELAKVRNGSIG